MAAQTCSGCGVWLAWGLFRCPRCHTVAPLYAATVQQQREENAMPRITVGAGPSNAAAAEGEVGFIKHAEHEAAEVAAGVEADVREAAGWADKPLAHLREAAKDRGLPASGSKADLAARLTEHEAGQQDTEQAPEQNGEQDEQEVAK